MYDLKITGGTILDGTGAKGYVGDIGIRGGIVVALGDAPEEAKETIQASGKIVCPGFVDIHTHYDAQILWDRMLSISPWHGVTTAVIGNCGFGIAPTRPQDRLRILQTLEKVEGMSIEAMQAGLGEDWGFESFPEYLDAIEARGMAINLGVMIGHTPMRLYVMGDESTERPANDNEIAAMRDMVAEAMQAGALGFASSKAITHVGYQGKPVPSRQAEPAELAELVSAMGDRGMMQVTIGPGFFINEMADIAQKTGRTISWTALLAGLQGPGGHRKSLQKTAELKKRHIPVVPQVSCRPLNFEWKYDDPFPFETMPLFNKLGAGSRDARIAAYADPAWRQQYRDELTPVLHGWASRTVVAEHAPDPAIEEQNLQQLADARGVDATDLALDLALGNDLKTRFRTGVINTDEDEVAELLSDPNVILGLSDAGAHASQLCDACFSTHLLSHWVREKGVLSLERAVHMLTQQPADVFGITDRGLLAEGRAADVVVFDPDTVGAGPLQRVYDLPGGADRLISEAAGIEAVIVNGHLLRRNGAQVLDAHGPLPGKLLRHGAADLAEAAE